MSHLRLPALVTALFLTLTSCTSTSQVKYLCPPLAPPTEQVVTALEEAGRKDPSSSAWVVELDRHYQKCDVLNSR